VLSEGWQPARSLPRILLCAVLVALFVPAVAGYSLAFRDTAHFYSPSFAWQTAQWQGGSIPTWNDQEGLGTDVVGDGSSSLFYPGKLLLVLLPLPWTVRLNLYILAHLLLAAAGTFTLARSWKLQYFPALLAAAGYSLSGPVLSLHANIPFLVSAAWLPWAVLQLDNLLRRGQPSAVIRLSLILAATILGGDPQTAYHVLLAGAVYLLVLPRREATSSRRQRLLLLSACMLLACMLSAIQLLPMLGQARQSTRNTADLPRSIYELSFKGESAHEQFQGLLGRAERSGEHAPYEFSVPPWRLAELAWPNISGRLYPHNQRWLRAIGAEGRIWTPTLYMGLLVMLLGWAGWSLRSGEVWVRWLSWLLMLSALASFGLYGAGWWLRQAGLLGSTTAATGSDPVGGLYWFMVVLLPGYAQFRFPAKLWVLVTLSACLLAARQMQRLEDGEHEPLARRLLGLVGVGVAGLVLVSVLRPLLLGLFAQGGADNLLGPLQLEAAWNGIAVALLHTTLLAVVLLVLISNLPASACGPLLVTLTILELAIANSYLVSHAPASYRSADSPLEILLDEESATTAAGPPQRMFRARKRGWYPRQWIAEPSRMRLAEAVAWDRQTLLPRYQLTTPLASLESSLSLPDRNLATLMAVGRQHGTRREDGIAEPDAELLRSLGIRWIAGPDDWYPGEPALYQELPGAASVPANFSLWRLAPYPFARVVHALRESGPVPTRPADLAAQMEAELYPDGQLVDLQQLVLLHGDPREVNLETGLAADASDLALPVFTRFEPTRRELRVELSRSGYLVLNQSYAPGWKAWSRESDAGQWKPLRIERANFVVSAIKLPAGRHEVLIRYQPTPLRAGAALSLAGLVVLLWLSRLFSPHRRREA